MSTCRPRKRVPTLATQEQVNTISFLSFGFSISFFLMCVQVHMQQRIFILCVCMLRVSDETQREQHSIARSAALVTQVLGWLLPESSRFNDVDTGTWMVVLRGVLSSRER